MPQSNNQPSQNLEASAVQSAVQSATQPASSEPQALPLEHPDTKPSQLANWTKKYIEETINPLEEASSNPDREDELHTVLEHPNTPTEALSSLYAKHKPDGNIIEKLLSHPNASASDAEDYLASIDLEGHHEEAATAAANHPGVNRETIKAKLNAAIHDDGIERVDFPSHLASSLDPKWALDLLQNAPQWEPVDHNMTDAQKRINNKVSKINKAALAALCSSKAHTPETLSATVEHIKDIHAKENPSGLSGNIAKLAENPLLTQPQIEELANIEAGAYRSDESFEKLFAHPNASPAFLQSVLNTDSELSQDKNAKIAALLSPKLPEDQRNAFLDRLISEDHLGWGDREFIYKYAESEVASPEQLVKIYPKHQDALNSPKFPQNVIQEKWDQEKDLAKNPDISRRFLRAKNLPPSVLKEIIRHKNLDVAAEALSHANVDQETVNLALKRKAKKVQEAASRHPLAPIEHAAKMIADGKMSAHGLIFGDHNKTSRRRYRSRNSENTPKFQIDANSSKIISDAYTGFDVANIKKMEGEGDEGVARYLKVKMHLTTSPGVPTDIREKNAKDIVDYWNAIKNIHRDRYSGLGSQLKSSIKTLAENGNLHAQEAALEDAGHISADFSKPAFGSDFLDRVVEKAKTTTHSAASPNNLLKNPNLSENTFNKIITENISSFGSSLYQYIDRYEDHNSLIDQKLLKFGKNQSEIDEFYKNLPEAKQKFTAASTEVSPDIWERAYLSLGINDRHEVSTNVNVSDLLKTPSILVSALKGNYDSGIDSNRFASSAIKKLDPAQPEHTAILKDAISSPGGQLSIPLGLKEISQSEFDNKKDFLFNVINDATKENPVAIAALVGVLDKINKPNSWGITHRDKSLVDEAIAKVRNSGDTKHQQFVFDTVLDQPDSAFTENLKKHKKGEMDFLADLGSTEVTKKALGLGLLSPEKVKSLQSELGIEVFKESDSYGQNDILMAMPKDQPIPADYIDHILDVPGLPRVLLGTSPIKRGGESDQNPNYIKAKSLVSHLADSIIAHKGDAPNRMSNLISRISNTNTTASHGGFYSKERTALIRDIVNKIQEMPKGLEKNKMILGTEDAFGAKPPFGKKHYEEINKDIAASNDIPSALEMLDKGKGTAILDKMILNGITNAPERFTNTDIATLHQVLTKRVSSSISTDTDKLLRATVEASLQRGPDYQNEAAVLLSNFVGAGAQLEPSSSSKRDIAARNQCLDTLIGLQNQQDNPELSQNSAESLYRIVNRPNTYPELAKKAFLAASPDIKSHLSIPVLSEKLVNDPEILEAATSGNKLLSLMASRDQATPETLNLITKRVLSTDNIDPQTLSSFISSTLKKSDLDQEAVLGLVRRVGPDLVTSTVKRAMEDFRDEEAAYSSLHHTFDDLSKALTQSVTNGLSNLDDMNAHAKAILDLENVATIINRYPDVPSNDYHAKKEKAEALTDSFFANIKIMQDHALSIVQGDEHGARKIRNAINSALKEVMAGKGGGTGSPKVRTYNFEHGIKWLEAKNSLPAANQPNPSFSMNFLERVKIPKDKWSNLYETDPNMAAMVATLKSIPKEAVLSIPDSTMSELVEADKPISSFITKVKPQDASELLPTLLEKIQKTGKENDAYHECFHAVILEAPHHLTAKQLLDYKEKHWHRYDDIFKTIMKSGAGGQELFNHEMNEAIGTKVDGTPNRQLLGVLSSPHIGSRITDALKLIGEKPAAAITDTVTKNLNSPKELIEEVIGKVGANDDSIAQHPNAPVEYVEDSFKNDINKYKPDFARRRNLDSIAALGNPTHGGRLFRSLQEAYELDNELIKSVDENKLIKEVQFSPSHQRLQQMLQLIPPEGISWQQFKTSNKSMENWPEAKRLFQGKTGTGEKVMPEDVAKVAEEFPSNRFHVSYTQWDGAQRHLGDRAKNLVVQINNSEETEKRLSKDPRLFKFFQYVQKWALTSSHPVSPHCIGWVRVDTTAGKDGWVIEEFQSDFSAKLRADLEKTLEQNPKGLLDNLGFHATKAELLGFTKEIEKVLSGWYHAAQAGMEKLAQQQGVEKLYLHGPNVRAQLSWLDADRPLPVKITEMYDKDPPKFGFEKCDYTEYPKTSKEVINGVKGLKTKDLTRKDTRCWVKKLKKA